MKLAAFLVFLAVSTFQLGCTGPEASTPAPSVHSSEESLRPDANLSQEGGGRSLAATESTSQSSNWDEFASLQAPTDRDYLQELNHRYFGALAFADENELRFLEGAGFPTPEEWLAAKSLSDSALQRKADAGDRKAAGIYADRMIKRLDELMAIEDEHPGSVPDKERAFLATMAVMYASQAMEGQQGLFGIYVNGVVKSSIHDSWEPMTAAMIEGMDRGDPRVDRLINELSARHPVQDVSAIHAAMKVVRAGSR